MDEPQATHYWEVNQRLIKPDGVYRCMKETGHFPLQESDYELLARAFGLGVGTMRHFIRTNRLETRLEDEVMSKLDCSKAKRLYEQGASDVAIAKECGMSANAIWHWRKKCGLASQPKRPKEDKPEIVDETSKKAEPDNPTVRVYEFFKLTADSVFQAMLDMPQDEHEKLMGKLVDVIKIQVIEDKKLTAPDAYDMIATLSANEREHLMKMLDYTMGFERDSLITKAALEGRISGMEYVIERLGARV